MQIAPPHHWQGAEGHRPAFDLPVLESFRREALTELRLGARQRSGRAIELGGRRGNGDCECEKKSSDFHG